MIKEISDVAPTDLQIKHLMNLRGVKLELDHKTKLAMEARVLLSYAVFARLNEVIHLGDKESIAFDEQKLIAALDVFNEFIEPALKEADIPLDFDV